LIKKNYIGEIFLFNLAENIEERNNLADSIPEKAEELHKRLKEKGCTCMVNDSFYQNGKLQLN